MFRDFFFCRNQNYDASVGCCLDALFSSCSDDVVKSTASDLIGIFHRSITRTRSSELKVCPCMLASIGSLVL